MPASPDIEVPAAWDEAADGILDVDLRKVLVLGATGVGKSSFCHVLSQRLLAAGQDVAVVDADVGQKDIGPPAAVTLGYPLSATPLAEIRAARFFFVGSPSPSGRLLPLTLGTLVLAQEARTTFLVVNTTGLIDGVGRVLKGYKIEALRPDVVVAIERSGELTPILSANGHVRILRLAPSSRARERGSEERAAARQTSFARYFAASRRAEFALDDLVFQRTILFTGMPFVAKDALYAEETADGPLLVQAAGAGRRSGARTLPAGFARNLLCGLADARGRGTGLATIERMDFAEGRIILNTPLLASDIRVIQFGDLCVSPEGRDLGPAPRELF